MQKAKIRNNWLAKNARVCAAFLRLFLKLRVSWPGCNSNLEPVLNQKSRNFYAATRLSFIFSIAFWNKGKTFLDIFIFVFEQIK